MSTISPRIDQILPEDQPRSGKIVGLQHLRAVAALIVVLDHVLVRSIRGGPENPWLTFIAAEIGAMGVWTFFVISGFIMLHISWNQFAQPGALVRFIRHRLLRVIPLYWFLTGVFFFIAPIPSGGLQLVKSLLFIPYLNFNNEIHPILEQGWTLNYEILLYAIFVIALAFGRRTGIVTAVLVLTALVFIGQIGDDLEPPARLWTSLPLILFILGISLAVMRRKITRLGQWRQASFWSAILLIAAAGGMSLITNKVEVTISGHAFYWQTVMLWLVCFISVGLVTLFHHSGENALGRTFEYLGDASYSIYLAHGFALAICGKIWDRFFPFMSSVMFALIAFIASVLSGGLVYILIEKPLIHFLSKKISR